MGFEPELTTRVTVEVDTSEIDNAISIMNSGLLADTGIVEQLEAQKEKLESIREPVAQAVAEALQSNQEMIISSKHFITGTMMNSVDIMVDGEDRLVANTAESTDGFPYPLAIEKGRREVTPVDAKVLRWFEGGVGGTPVFSKRSRAVKADPFVQPSIDDTLDQIEQIVYEKFG